MLKMLPVSNPTVSMSNVCDAIGSGEDRNLGEAIVVSIQSLSLQRSNNIVSDNSNLVPSSPESFSGRQIANITKTEDILVDSMLQGLMVNV